MTVLEVPLHSAGLVAACTSQWRNGRHLFERLARPPAAARPTARTRWRRSFWTYHPDPEAHPADRVEEGENLATRRQPIRKKRDCSSRGDAAERVGGNVFVVRGASASVGSDGWGAPRRAASGLARLLARAGPSRGGCVAGPLCSDALCRVSGSRDEGAELRACAVCDDLLARKSPWVTVRARDRMSTMLCTAHA